MTNNPFYFLEILSKLLDQHGSIVLTRTDRGDEKVDRIELGVNVDSAPCGTIDIDHRHPLERSVSHKAIDLGRMLAKLEEGPPATPPQPIEQEPELLDPGHPAELDDPAIVEDTTGDEQEGS